MLVVVGVLQFVTFVAQAYFLRRTIKDGERTIRIAEKAANAAELQARAAIGVELPVLVVDQVRLVSNGPVDASLVAPRFEVIIKNFGRTAAFLIKSGADTYIGQLPARPTWLEYFDLDSTVVIEKGDPPYVMETIRRKQSLNPVEVGQIMNGGYFWVCWFIVYRDFLGRRAIYRDARRLWVMEPSGVHIFIDEAPEAYRGTAFVADDGTIA